MKDTAIQRITDTPIVYDVTDEGLKALEARWAEIPDCTFKPSYELVRVGIGEVVKLRTSVEKRRKDLKADSLKYGQRVDDAAKAIRSRLVAIETPLKDAKGKVDEVKRLEKDAKALKECERVDGIQAKIQLIRNQGNVKWGEPADQIASRCLTVNDMVVEESEYQEFLEDALAIKQEVVRTLFDARKTAEAKEAQDAAEKAERERVQAEQAKENERLAAEREKIELERKELAEQQAAIDEAAAQKAKVERDEETRQTEDPVRTDHFNDIVDALDKCGDSKSIALSIIDGSIPWVKYTG